MPGKRRLSGGLGLLGAAGEDSSDDEKSFVVTPIKSPSGNGRRRSSFGGTFANGRRRSSFGGGLSKLKSSDEQSRIADMYKLVIKMSSENVCSFVTLCLEIIRLHYLFYVCLCI